MVCFFFLKMKRRLGHAMTELIHNWSGSRDAMKCCAIRVMTFTSGDGATHGCTTTATHFKCFMCIQQFHSGTVEANAHSNTNCKHRVLLLWAVWATWVTNQLHSLLLDTLNVGDWCLSLFLKNTRQCAKILIDFSYLSQPVFLSSYLYSTHLSPSFDVRKSL